ncbi:hypothetical protein GDO81_012501 [Engystomops pustulosus]|uniref:Uncharacterized protein n=1 Tax=Engystomops pustulosus TaxID=76066 RepID=A0AAV7BMH2_ENGPU|nr:hypothetical protein GDO81_012501 [Engystomops pustulosus]
MSDRGLPPLYRIEGTAPSTESPAPSTESPAPSTESPAPSTESPAPSTESPALRPLHPWSYKPPARRLRLAPYSGDSFSMNFADSAWMQLWWALQRSL